MMKSTLRIFIVLLLIAGICFGGLSCGSSKSKPKKKASTSQKDKNKKKKKKDKQEEPKPVVKEEPVVPAKPPLPQDLTQWGSKDFLRAREEGHPRLVEACLLLGAPFEGEESAPSAVEIIRQILLPLPIPEMKQIPKPVITEDTSPKEKQRLEREYEKKVKEEEERVKNVPTLDSRSIAALTEILGQNGDDAAWKLLLEMLQRKITVDDDSDMDKYIVQTILTHPRSNNIDIVFTMLTNPASLLRPVLAQAQTNNKSKETDPEWIRKQAVDWVKKYADPAFRERLTRYLIAHPKDKTLKELVLPIMLEDKVGNIQVKAMMYMADGFLSDSDKQKVERYFLDCSVGAYAAVTYQTINSGKNSASDICAVIEQDKKAQQEEAKENEEEANAEDAKDNSDSENTQSSKEKTKVGKNGTYRLEVYEDMSMTSTESLKIMILHPEYAQMVLQIVWQNDFISKQLSIWETKKDLNSRELDTTVRFLFALPLGNYRQYWSDYFDSIYQDGPTESGLDKCPLMGTLPIDPSVLMELKKLKRSVIPPTTAKKGTKGSGMSKAKEKNIALQAAWMDSVRLAVKAQMDRCNASCPIQVALGIENSKLKARIPFSIPEDAKIVGEYHFVFPTEEVRKITGVVFDPYEIHFVAIDWDGPAYSITNKIKYKESGTAKLRYTAKSSDKMVWLEYNSDDFSESMDIRFTAKGITKEALREPASGPIQIMSIRVKPTGE